MKHVRVWSAILAVVLSLAPLACSKKDQGADLAKLLARPGLPFQLTAQGHSSTPEGEATLVRFTQVNMTFNPEFMKTVNPALAKLGEEGIRQIRMSADEISFRFIPEKLLELTGMSNLQISFTPPEGASKAIPLSLDLKMGQFEGKGMIMSPFIATEIPDATTLFLQLVELGKQHQSSVRDLSWDLRITEPKTPEAEGKGFQVKGTCAAIHAEQQGDSTLVKSLYGKEGTDPLPLLNAALQNKTTLFSVHLKVENLNMDGMKQGETTPFFNAKSDMLEVSYSLKPEDSGKGFSFSTGSGLKGLSITLSGTDETSQKMNSLLRLNELKTSFIMAPLNPTFIASYLNLARMGMKMNGASEEEQKTMQAGLAQKGMEIASAFVASQPQITLVVDPLDHPFGHLSGNAVASLPSLMTPQVKAEARILKLEEVLSTLATELKLGEAEAKAMRGTLGHLFPLQADGSGLLTFEMKPDQPGKPLLNGQPLK